MKTILATLIFLGTTSLFAQTSVIAVKSHHGDLTEIPDAPDRFGEFIPTPTYDTIIKINGDCVIQIGEDNGLGLPFRDTVCDHWYYKSVKYNVDKVEEYHGKKVVLIGFDEDGSNVEIKQNPFFKKRGKKQSVEWILGFILFSGLAIYIFRPNLAISKKQ